MRKDNLGHPSRINKSEGTGNAAAGDDDKNKMATEKYTTKDDEIADNIPVRHANRNTDKEKPTGAGGYKQ